MTVIQKEIKAVKLEDIQQNALNNRSMDASEIKNMADAIAKGGVCEPLVVYKNRDNDKYTLISGHRRLAALKQIFKKDEPVLCIISETPESKFQEQEMLARLNIHRSTPDDIQQEASLASRLWQTMDDEKRATLTEMYKEKFIEKHKDNPSYQEDPSKFISDRFRPRLDYVRSLTGLEVSNGTIKDILRDPAKKEEKKKEKEEKKESEKKEKDVSDRDLLRQAESLLGVLKIHATMDDNLNARKGMCIEALDTLIEYLR